MRRPRSSLIAFAGVFLGGVFLIVAPPVEAQQELVSPARASELKRAAFPYVRFSTLASFDLPEAEGFTHGAPAAAPAPILALPENVVNLDGSAASIRGYMLPIDVNAEGVRSFLLTSSIDSCHWGMIGLPNEWVLVEMPEGRRVPFVQFQPVTVFGRLSVEPAYLGSQLSGLYQMRGEYVAGERQ